MSVRGIFHTETIVIQVPVQLARINSTEHPVKVGLSDAFMALLSPQPSGQFYSYFISTRDGGVSMQGIRPIPGLFQSFGAHNGPSGHSFE